jgi:gliding motility-associated-like protein
MRQLLTPLLLLFGICFHSFLFAQSNLFLDDFESTSVWSVSGSNSPNTWVVGNCVSSSGNQSAYITSGGTSNDCSATGINHYGYVNAPSNSLITYYTRPVNATCFSNLSAEFDIQLNGSLVDDFAEVVYSTDNGVNWNILATYANLPTFQQQTLALPANCNLTNFLFGFRFTYNNVTINGLPPAIDNVRIYGTTVDNTQPLISCPATLNLYAGSNCQTTLPNLQSLVVASDNCTSLSNLTFSQSPLAGTIVSGNVTTTITVTDATSNATSCSTQFLFVDTTGPTITCPSAHVLYPTSGCNAQVPNIVPEVIASDNCSSVTLSQSPAPGTSLSAGYYVILISAHDAQGNPTSCYTPFSILDTIAPIISCPDTIDIPSNLFCNSLVGNITGLVTGIDNCLSSNLLVFTQNVGPTVSFNGILPVVVTGNDLFNNTASCTILLRSIDTSGPHVACVSDTSLAISNPCNYTIPDLSGTHSAYDNCTSTTNLTFTQYPAPGTTGSNETSVYITYTDLQGNHTSCITHILPLDIVAPVISCPPAQVVNNVAQCTSVLPDLTSMVTLSENCSGFTLVQSPPAGTVLTSGTHPITLMVTDIGGNSQSCITHFTITETIPPTISCPNSITSCNPHVTYSAPNANDNCLFVLTQTDGTGLTSGSYFPIGITQQNYLVVDSSGNSAQCSFTIQVLEYPDTAAIVQDTIYLCSVFETTVDALPITSGTGTWSVISGGATIVNPSQTSTTVQNLSLGMNRIQWIVSSPTCGTKSDTVYIVVNTPSQPATIQDTMIVCSANNNTLQGSFPSSGIATWSSNASLLFGDIHAAITTVSNVPIGFTTIYWNIINPGCAISADTGVIYFPNQAEISTADSSYCLSELPLTIVGNSKSLGEFSSWYISSGVASLSSQFNATSSIIDANPGNVKLVYKLKHPSCPATTDTLHVQFINCEDGLSNIPTLFTPNGDGDNDYFELTNLSANYPNAEVKIVNRWGNQVFESIGYNEPWDGTYKSEPLPMGTYFYHISSPTNAFETITGAISIIR